MVKVSNSETTMQILELIKQMVDIFQLLGSKVTDKQGENGRMTHVIMG